MLFLWLLWEIFGLQCLGRDIYFTFYFHTFFVALWSSHLSSRRHENIFYETNFTYNKIIKNNYYGKCIHFVLQLSKTLMHSRSWCSFLLLGNSEGFPREWLFHFHSIHWHVLNVIFGAACHHPSLPVVWLSLTSRDFLALCMTQKKIIDSQGRDEEEGEQWE